MRFKDVFAIIGPAMIGPSSSHTAGAVRIGRVARQLLDRVPERANVTLYGSFAETYAGHGTDTAIAGGLLDYDTDNPRVTRALDEATSAGISITFRIGTGVVPHPNFASIEAEADGRHAAVTGASIGGGSIEIYSMNGFAAGCSGRHPTLIITHADISGFLAVVTAAVSDAGLNIGFMKVDRKSRFGEAMTVMELDKRPTSELLKRVRNMPLVAEAVVINLSAGS